MNTYVDMMNEAEGFNKAKLDRVFEQIAEVDQNYGSQIEKCTEDIVHYNKVLEQLVGVMEQAFSGSSNGNAIFEFGQGSVSGHGEGGQECYGYCICG